MDGWLHPVVAEKFQTALNALDTPDGPDVPREVRRSPAQRRHDALDELLTRTLDQGELPSVRRERPHVSITVDLQALLGDDDLGVGEWSDTLDIATVQMLVCDATIHPIITNGRGWNR